MDRASCDPRRMLTCSWYAGVAGFGDWGLDLGPQDTSCSAIHQDHFRVVLSIRVMIVSSGGVLVLGHLSLLPLRLTKDRPRC